ncbi:MAG TPA: selenide, water dikinase SelD [Chloroflexi bacterium]|nr:selenide, water dikinase SelD [Chloroflexota bacterium]
MGPGDLEKILIPLSGYIHPDLIVGLEGGDDAAVYRISREQAIIQTVDFFPPVVDDPYDYGAIAAANAMSDVYAMGGEVLLALNVAAFPATMPMEIINEILRGGAEKVAEAGGVVAGGHTLTDEEPKYGLCVTGIVHPDSVVTRAGAQVGDTLILTKPLGVGLITTALRAQEADPVHVEGAVKSMLRLNRAAAQAMQEVGVHACTDITGFALLGHAWEMAERSKVGLKISLNSLPLLPGALDYAARGFVPGGLVRNRQYILENDRAVLPEGLSEEMIDLLFCPETSGGLLMALPPDRLTRLQELLTQRGEEHWVIGEVIEGEKIEVVA